MGMKPLVSLLVLCGNLSGSEMRGTVHDDLTAGFISAGLGQPARVSILAT